MMNGGLKVTSPGPIEAESGDMIKAERDRLRAEVERLQSIVRCSSAYFEIEQLRDQLAQARRALEHTRCTCKFVSPCVRCEALAALDDPKKLK